jgi:hypothetical protein
MIYMYYEIKWQKIIQNRDQQNNELAIKQRHNRSHCSSSRISQTLGVNKACRNRPEKDTKYVIWEREYICINNMRKSTCRKNLIYMRVCVCVAHWLMFNVEYKTSIVQQAPARKKTIWGPQNKECSLFRGYILQAISKYTNA